MKLLLKPSVLLVLAAGCATTGTGKPPSMGCIDVMSEDCDDPSAHPPLAAMLPPWPFPRLIQPLPEAGQGPNEHRRTP